MSWIWAGAKRFKSAKLTWSKHSVGRLEPRLQANVNIGIPGNCWRVHQCTRRRKLVSLGRQNLTGAWGARSLCSPLIIILMLKLLSSLPFLSLHFHVSPSLFISEFSDPFLVQAFILACMPHKMSRTWKNNPLHRKKCREKNKEQCSNQGKKYLQ
jgi:hypothetical protein